MIEFRTQLQSRLMSLTQSWVGVGTDPTNYVKTFDDHLHDIAYDQNPFFVINVRTAEKAGESEIGTRYDLYMWTVHFYYIDITTNYEAGDTKRNHILGLLLKRLEENRRLGNLEVVDTEGNREYIYDSSTSAVLFDSSGQEDYYTFVSELYLNVYTARN